jgi:hypothetical protein
MLVLSVISLLVACISFWILRRITDEIMQLTVLILGMLCLFLSLVHSPWLMKLCVTVPLLILPLYHPTAQPALLTCLTCPKSCQVCRRP